MQFELNAEISGNINAVLSELGRNNVRKTVKLLEDSLAVLKKRNKLIQIADKSEGGWKTVDEYLSDEVASDSEDEKRIRAADNRAVKKIKSSKKEDKKRGKKRPAVAAGATTQTSHNGRRSISSRSAFNSICTWLPLNLKDGSAFFTLLDKLTTLSFKLFSIPDSLSFMYVFNHENRSAFVTSSVELLGCLELALNESSSNNSLSDISTKLNFFFTQK
jgi:hypothetical protein